MQRLLLHNDGEVVYLRYLTTLPCRLVPWKRYGTDDRALEGQLQKIPHANASYQF